MLSHRFQGSCFIVNFCILSLVFFFRPIFHHTCDVHIVTVDQRELKFALTIALKENSKMALG